MSFLTSRSTFLLRSAATFPARSFHTCLRRAALSESDTHRHDEERKAEIDKHKGESLGKQKDGKGTWKHELASSSEAAVKADRGEVEASEATIKKMQQETEEMAKKQR